jgi:hypothetical protein
MSRVQFFFNLMYYHYRYNTSITHAAFDGSNMEEELVNYVKDEEEAFKKSIFMSRDKLVEIWKGSRAFCEDINKEALPNILNT